MTGRLGVCSWSLAPASPAELAQRVRALGLSGVQLHLDPLRTGAWSEADTLHALAGAGLALFSGMMTLTGEDYSTLESIRASGGLRPAEHWQANLAAAAGNAALARRLGIELVSLHAGFLPADVLDPEREVLLERLRLVVDAFAAEGVRVAFETGQESAETLLGVLTDLGRPAAGVNFDPANMILYGMGEPVAALRKLVPWVRQIHVKDALRTRRPGTWGDEVPVGSGDVDWRAFFGVVRAAGLDCDLLIEREAGDDRERDIRTARLLVEGLWT